MAKYPDLKSYLQENYIELFTSEIQKFVDGNFDGGGFHSINVLSLLKHKIENVVVKALTCHDAPGPIVKMDVGLSADIVELGLGTKEYEADRKLLWSSIFVTLVTKKYRIAAGRISELPDPVKDASHRNSGLVLDRICTL